MDLMKVLMYPYGSDDPIAFTIYNSVYEVEHYIGRGWTEIELTNEFVLIFNSDEFEEDKYQPKYQIYGNFFILKGKAGDYESLSDLEVKYVVENIDKLLKFDESTS